MSIITAGSPMVGNPIIVQLIYIVLELKLIEVPTI